MISLKGHKSLELSDVELQSLLQTDDITPRQNSNDFRKRRKSHFRKTQGCVTCVVLCIHIVLAALIAWILITPILNPSYTHVPAHYTGGNPHQEKVFVAACIVNPDLIRGAWGRAVLELVEAVGPENLFLSIYENDSGPETKEALQELSEKITCTSHVSKPATTLLIPSQVRKL